MKTMNHETRYTGIQPQYFPRLHYFARILNTDIFLLRDDCQFVRKHKYPDGRNDKSHQAHTPLKQNYGIQFLAIPVRHEGYKSIAQTSLSYDDDWIHDHLRTIHIAYSKSPYFKAIFKDLEMILGRKYESLADLNISTIIWGLLRLLGKTGISEKDLTFETVLDLLHAQKIFRLGTIQKASQSQAAIHFSDMSANEKIVALCKEYRATVDYCGGTGVAAYLDHSFFEQNNIAVQVQDWKCTMYPQQFERTQGFIPNLSIIDLLMNLDAKRAQEIIMDEELKQ